MAAAAIAELASRGRRIGITSNSHKAIQKLIEEVQKRTPPGAPALRITKINRDPDDELVARGLVRGAEGMKDVDLDAPDAPHIVGGTAWAFADPSAAGQMFLTSTSGPVVPGEYCLSTKGRPVFMSTFGAQFTCGSNFSATNSSPVTRLSV